MKKSKQKKNAVNHLAEALKILSEPNRLRFLCVLGYECLPVTDIIRATGLAQTNVSFHLRILREAGLVRPERQGAYIYYRLADPQLLNILADMSVWLQQSRKKHKSRKQKETPKARKFCKLGKAAR